MRRAFTMVELIFVIVIIAILIAISVPKFNATRDDATLTKAKSTLSSIRSAITQEAQRKMMSGDYTVIKKIGGVQNGYNKPIFDYFDDNITRVLDYPPYSCKNSTSKGCWIMSAEDEYTYFFPLAVGGSAKFKIVNSRFDCISSDKSKCRLLEN